jgi:hypothetical protein
MTFSCLATAQSDPVRVIPPQNKTLSSDHGRYVLGQISEFRRDQYLLDTVTGRVWVIATRKPADGKGEGFSVLTPIPFEDISGSLLNNKGEVLVLPK